MRSGTVAGSRSSATTSATVTARPAGCPRAPSIAERLVAELHLIAVSRVGGGRQAHVGATDGGERLELIGGPRGHRPAERRGRVDHRARADLPHPPGAL